MGGDDQSRLNKKSKLILSLDKKSYIDDFGSKANEPQVITPDLNSTYDNIAEEEDDEKNDISKASAPTIQNTSGNYTDFSSADNKSSVSSIKV